MNDLVKHDSELVNDLAAASSGYVDTNSVAAKHQLKKAELITMLQSDKALLGAVSARVAELRMTGEGIEAAAQAGLHDVVARLRSVAKDPDSSDAAIIRSGELLNKLSAQERKAGLRAQAKEGVGDVFVLNINLAGDKEPITIKGEVLDHEDFHDE